MPSGYEKPTVTPLYGDGAVEPEAIALVVGPVVGAGVGAVVVAGAVAWVVAWAAGGSEEPK